LKKDNFIFFKDLHIANLRLSDCVCVFVYYAMLSSSSAIYVTPQCLKLCHRENKDAAELSKFTTGRKEATR